MLLVTHWTPGKQIVGGILPPRGSSFEQSDELAEVIEIVACDQRRFVDVGPGTWERKCPTMAEREVAPISSRLAASEISLDRMSRFSRANIAPSLTAKDWSRVLVHYGCQSVTS